MKKLLLLALLLSTVALVACEYHGKQPVDETYYKRTQSVGWPEKQEK